MNWAIDTLWTTFVTRMQTINSARQCLGVMDAQDWPPKDVVFNAFYLIVVGENVVGKSFDSATIPVYETTLQFTWVSQGSDASTAGNLEGRYRGDRYRTNQTMKEELVKGLYPRYGLKMEFPTTPLANAADYAPTIKCPQEPIWWTPPSFMVRANKESGQLFTTASLKLVSMTETILA